MNRRLYPTISVLQPISPDKAAAMFLIEKEENCAYDTIENYEQGLAIFGDWADRYGLENMNNLTGRDLRNFKSWRKSKPELSKITLNGNLAVVKTFLGFCEGIEAVQVGTAEKVPMPEVDDEEEVRMDPPKDELVWSAREFLDKYQYGSRIHVEVELIAEIGIRNGACRALDEKDFYPSEKKIHIRHRPEGSDERGTPLKNGSDGERNVTISSKLRDIIQAYLNSPERPEGADKYGRKPLLTCEDSQGNVCRIGVNRIRDDFYKIFRPCQIYDRCPDDRDIDDCEATKARIAHNCPENTTPHPLRTWSITYQLEQDMDMAKLSDRVDVSVPTIKKHYDDRTEERKRKQRLAEVGKLPRYSDEYTENDGGDFNGTPIAVNPLLTCIFAAMKLSKWAQQRLQRELRSMAPSDDSVQVSTGKAAKGGAAYAFLVTLLAVNFVLLGAF